MIGILSSWSLRRIRASLTIWGQLAVLALKDWTTVVYLVIPGTALAVYEGFQYYQGTWFLGMTPATPVAGPLSLQPLATVGVFLFLAVVLFSTFGHLPFPLQSGDKAYVLGAPVARWNWGFTIWGEGALWNLFLLAIPTVLTLPLIWFFQMSTPAWLAGWALLALTLNSARILGTLWRRQEQFHFLRFLIYQSLRLGFFILIATGGTALMAGHNLMCFGVLLPTCVLSTAWALWLQNKRSWDTFFYASGSVLLLPLLAGMSPAHRKETTFFAKIFSQLVIQTCEFILRRPLHPVTWLTLVRTLRKRGVVRDYALFTAGALGIMSFGALAIVQVAGIAFLLYLLYQYWKSTIRPLYRIPAQEQSIASRWDLEVVGSRMAFAAIVFSTVLWVVLGFVITEARL